MKKLFKYNIKLFGLSTTLSLLTLTGCFEKESIITPAEINEIKIPYSLYEYQTYFRLDDEEIVSFNHFAEWDLGFECSSDGYHIILNASRYMLAGTTGQTDFSAVTSNMADTLVFDDSSGDLSLTALEGWADYSDPLNPVFPAEVYIIDRGLDELGNSFGLKKVIFESLGTGGYSFRFANLDGSDEYSYTVAKSPGFNFVLFSFDNGGTVFSDQPASVEWDLLFTKYSTIILDDYGVPTPYIVRGVYINGLSGVSASIDTTDSFYSLKYSNIPDYQFSSWQDAIGYEWKEYNNESYTLVNGISYLVKNQGGTFYKMRFTDYFNESGEKGYPAFELIRLIE